MDQRNRRMSRLILFGWLDDFVDLITQGLLALEHGTDPLEPIYSTLFRRNAHSGDVFTIRTVMFP